MRRAGSSFTVGEKSVGVGNHKDLDSSSLCCVAPWARATSLDLNFSHPSRGNITKKKRILIIIIYGLGFVFAERTVEGRFRDNKF